MKAVALTFCFLFSMAAHAEDIRCDQPSSAIAQDFCQISYKTLARVQEMQINQELPAELDILKMQGLLGDGKIQTTEIQPESWTGLKKLDKANRSFKLLLKKSGQTEFYKAQESLGTDLKQHDTRFDSTTGTRGGGFGSEDYILPSGFWID